MNSFGRKFRISIFGESHGQSIGIVVDGVPPGLTLTTELLENDLKRRQSGAAGTTPRHERDIPHIISGTYNDCTTGAPVTICFNNENTQSSDYKNLAAHPRPSHADLVAIQKFGGHNDPRGGGHFSGRLTLALVAAGTIAKQIIPKVRITSQFTHIGGSPIAKVNGTYCTNRRSAPENSTQLAAEQQQSLLAEQQQFLSAEQQQLLSAAMADNDSLGAVIECRATGIEAGLGEPFFDSVESLLSHLLFSIPGIRGVEFGTGFAAAAMRGSEHNDAIINAQGTTATNNAGGIVGGISNGNELILRVAVKPAASIGQSQDSYNFDKQSVDPLLIQGRHDTCIALRMPVIVEAAVAIVLADLRLTTS